MKHEADNFLQGQTPLEILKNWLEDATARANLKNPNAFVLSTANKEGRPSSRVVLLKEIRPEGLVFYTNYESRKGHDLNANPQAAVNFHWDALGRQVLLEGRVEKIPRGESETYWTTRPRASQLSQWLSKQSQIVPSREQMEREFVAAEARFANKDVPCPPHWGGYLFRPANVEFWIGRDGRFHDRYAYTYQKVENAWAGHRLYP